MGGGGKGWGKGGVEEGWIGVLYQGVSVLYQSVLVLRPSCEPGEREVSRVVLYTHSFLSNFETIETMFVDSIYPLTF